jgi:hypothetical protein
MFHINNVKYTRDKAWDKTHSSRTLENVSNVTTHKTNKHLTTH